MRWREPADINVDELRRSARGAAWSGAIVLALGVAVIVPMLLETEQKPLGEDVSVKIPPIDDGKFVNRLTENRAQGRRRHAGQGTTEGRSREGSGRHRQPPVEAPTAPPKYDTRTSGCAADARNEPDATAEPRRKARTVKPPPKPSPDADESIAAERRRPPTQAGRTSATARRAARSRGSRPRQPMPPHEGFAVQLAAFADDKGANALAGRLKKSGYAAYTEPLKTSKGTLWRVRVGPYPSREAARPHGTN